MSFYRRKPLVVEARQFIQPIDIGELAAWCGGEWHFDLSDPDTKPAQYITVPTLEGPLLADPGYWIIKGVVGEFHICRPDIFEATYESAGEDDAVTVSRRDLRAFMCRGEFAYVTEANCREIGRERQEAEIRLAKAALSK